MQVGGENENCIIGHKDGSICIDIFLWNYIDPVHNGQERVPFVTLQEEKLTFS